MRFEEFGSGFDDAFRRVFTFLDSGPTTVSLLKGAAQYDLQRAQPGDEKHVSATSDKSPLRMHLLEDKLLHRLLEKLGILVFVGW